MTTTSNRFADIPTEADEVPAGDVVEADDPEEFVSRMRGETTQEREHWCVAAIKELTPFIKKQTGRDLPPRVKVSCSLIRERKLDAKGETWLEGTSKDGWSNLFVSAGVDDSHEVLAIVLHELIHVFLQSQDHRPISNFPYFHRSLGFGGKPTGYDIASDATKKVFRDIVAKIGPYPHRKLVEESKPRAKDGTRQKLVGCPLCESKWRSSRQQIRNGLSFCGTKLPGSYYSDTKPTTRRKWADRCPGFQKQVHQIWCADCSGYGDHFTEDCPSTAAPTQP